MIDGSMFIGGSARQSAQTFRAVDPATGEIIGPPFCEAGSEDVADACALAAAAAPAFGQLPPEDRAAFLEAVAEAVLAVGDELIVTAMRESGLPRARLEGERGRTVGQLRLFADEVRRGAWLDAVIEPALSERVPPRPDLRRMNVALGPVAVFGASNFPLAFSVAGGDTASALAAGCPVVVKGHPAHPGTGELVARAVAGAAAACGLPGGVFSYLPGTTHALGAALVADPRIKAVGFTGSRAGGLALVDVAARRDEPIPVFAEMSSINPVVLMPYALERSAEALGQAFAASLTLGAGQFCTNPGLLLGMEGPALDRFLASATAALTAADPAMMLSSGIHDAYARGVASLGDRPGVKALLDQRQTGRNRCVPALFEAVSDVFLADPQLRDEVFGASALVVRCADAADLCRVLGALDGQLTATLHLGADDAEVAAPILELVQARAGRILANGWPTGVEVARAMVHGGPFPATLDARSTSVGTLAMMRFLRPVCFQDMPDSLLPPPLKHGNPWNIPRTD